MLVSRIHTHNDCGSLLFNVALIALFLFANLCAGLADGGTQKQQTQEKSSTSHRKGNDVPVKKTTGGYDGDSSAAVNGDSNKGSNDTGGAVASQNGSGGSSNTNPSSKAKGLDRGEKPMTQRALCVLVVVSATVIVYFVIRTVRLRRKNKKTRKYGVLDTNIENMELTPLEQDDDEDDTLFDASHPRR
ncbi:membrane protein FAM174A isoform X2 [Protopterus annectens]|nr:membrane protein FAM174A isoform X2 [Protopterus annectens]